MVLGPNAQRGPIGFPSGPLGFQVGPLVFLCISPFPPRIYRFMKHIKTFPLFESHSLSDNQKKLLDASCEGFLDTKWIQNPETGRISVLGNFNATDYYLKLASDKRKIREVFQSLSFDVIEGDFEVRRMFLSTMQGFPSVIEGELIAGGNEFMTAEGAPKTIYKELDLSQNHLVSLEGMEDTEVKSFTYLTDNWIRSKELTRDLEEAKRLGTWTPAYLRILSGATPFNSNTGPNQREEAKEFILEQKLTKDKLEEAIRLAPAEMKVALSRKKDTPQEFQALLLTLDVPADFWEDSDLIGDLSDVGL